MKYAFIQRHRRVWPISVQCRVLRHGIASSMSRKGNCWDNACSESLFGSLKVRLSPQKPNNHTGCDQTFESLRGQVSTSSRLRISVWSLYEKISA